MERSDRYFEEQWHNAFSNESIQPSDRVWNNIDHALSNQENVYLRLNMKRSKWLVAATIFFAVLATATGYWFGQQSNTDTNLNNTTANNTHSDPNDEQTLIPLSKSSKMNENKSDSEEGTKEIKAIAPSKNEVKTTSKNLITSTANEEEDIENEQEKKGLNTVTSTNKRRTDAVTGKSFDGNAKIIAIEEGNDGKEGVNSSILEMKEEMYSSSLGKIDGLGLDLDYALAHVEPEFIYYYSPDFDYSEDKAEENLWGGLGLAGGNFNPEGVQPIMNNGDMAFANEALSPGLDNDRQSSLYAKDLTGTSRILSANVGKRISKKWALMSGVSYSQLVSGTEVSPSYQRSYNTLSDAESNATADVYIQQNKYDYITIPFEMGYYLVDKKVGCMLRSGINASALINSSNEVLSDNQSTFGIRDREVNNLLMWYVLGMELNYNLNKNYTLALAPGYRMAINSHEAESDFKPTSAELAFRMRYNF